LDRGDTAKKQAIVGYAVFCPATGEKLEIAQVIIAAFEP
jgi:hypothetical protein